MLSCEWFLKVQDARWIFFVQLNKEGPTNSPGRAFFNVHWYYRYYYLVSIPSSRIWSFTASIGTSSLWKIPAAKAASALVFSKTSEKCSTQPAPEDAITGIETVFLNGWSAQSPCCDNLPCFYFIEKTIFFYFISGCDKVKIADVGMKCGSQK